MDIQNYGDRHKLQKDINLHIKWPEKNNTRESRPAAGEFQHFRARENSF